MPEAIATLSRARKRRQAPDLEALLSIARELNDDERDLLLFFARQILERRSQHGELHVETDLRCYSPEHVADFARGLVDQAEQLVTRVKLAAAMLSAFSRPPATGASADA